MFQIINQAIYSCFSFKIYEKIYNQKIIKSMIFFTSIIFITHLIIYPKYFNEKKNIIFPVLNHLSKEFPSIDFENYQINSLTPETKEIDLDSVKVVIDPFNKLNKKWLSPIQIFLNQKTIEIKYTNYEHKIQTFHYNHPTVSILLIELAKFKNGTGRLNGDFFLRFQDVLLAGYIPYFFLFILTSFFSTLIFSYIISLMGNLYSKIINVDIAWKEIRNLSYYAITPVLLLKIITAYLNINYDRISPLFFFTYSLFLCRAISQIKKIDQHEHS